MRAAHLAKWCFYYSRMTIPTDRPDVEATLPIECVETARFSDLGQLFACAKFRAGLKGVAEIASAYYRTIPGTMARTSLGAELIARADAARLRGWGSSAGTDAS